MRIRQPTFLVRFNILQELFFDGKKGKYRLFKHTSISNRSFQKHILNLERKSLIRKEGKILVITKKGANIVKNMYPLLNEIKLLAQTQNSLKQ